MDVDINAVVAVFQQRFPREYEIAVLTVALHNAQNGEQPEAGEDS